MVKQILIISIIAFIKLGYALIEQKYSSMFNTSINSNKISSRLIGNYLMNGKLKCLAQCNSIVNCYTLIYNKDLNSSTNCALYSKYFATSELISLENYVLYYRECKYFN